MSRANEMILSTDDFRIQKDQEGHVQLSLGPVSIGMTLDAALDLQHRLAVFLACQELNDYLPEGESPVLDPFLAESRNGLLTLVRGAISDMRKLDS